MSYLSKIKGIEPELLSLLKGHDLNITGPGRVVAVGNRIKQVSDGIIRVGGREVFCLLHRQILYALIRLKEKKKQQHTTSVMT